MQYFGISKELLRTPKFKRYYEHVGAGALVLALVVTGYIAVTRTLEGNRLRGDLSASTNSNNELSIKVASLVKQIDDNKTASEAEIHNILSAKEDRLNAFALQAQKCDAIKKKLGIKG